MAGPEPGTGAGVAHDATAEIGESRLTPEELAEWAIFQAARNREVHVDQVERMQRKVAKAEADLDAAREALADAEAALAALGG